MKRIAMFPVALVVVALAQPAVAQNDVDVYFAAYMEAVNYPERFDSWVARNREHFTPRFLGAMDRMQGQLLQLANEDIQLCRGHVNPEWRSQCLQESIPANLFFFNAGLRAVLGGQARWVDTDRGQLAVFAKNMYLQMGGGDLTGMTWEQVFDWSFRLMEPQLRPYVNRLMQQ